MKSKIKMVVLTDSFLGRKGLEIEVSTPRQMQQLVKNGLANVKEDEPKDKVTDKQESPKAPPKKQGKK